MVSTAENKPVIDAQSTQAVATKPQNESLDKAKSTPTGTPTGTPTADLTAKECVSRFALNG